MDANGQDRWSPRTSAEKRVLGLVAVAFFFIGLAFILPFVWRADGIVAGAHAILVFLGTLSFAGLAGFAGVVHSVRNRSELRSRFRGLAIAPTILIGITMLGFVGVMLWLNTQAAESSSPGAGPPPTTPLETAP